MEYIPLNFTDISTGFYWPFQADWTLNYIIDTNTDCIHSVINLLQVLPPGILSTVCILYYLENRLLFYKCVCAVNMCAC